MPTLNDTLSSHFLFTSRHSSNSDRQLPVRGACAVIAACEALEVIDLAQHPRWYRNSRPASKICGRESVEVYYSPSLSLPNWKLSS